MRQHSIKFWLIFTVIALLFLGGWFLFWETRQQGLSMIGKLTSVLPINPETKADLSTFLSIGDSVLHTDGKEKVYLVLFQNNLELRPGGGFIGSFGILGVRDGSVTRFDVHDTGNFDTRVPDTVTPPYPMKETLKIPSLKMRDSNYSPDFPTNIEQAEYFYHLGGGGEQFDGVIAITTDVLSSFLTVTGPVEIPGFPGTFGPDNAIIDLEYQVEQGYQQQGIGFADRKSVIHLLGDEILRRAKAMSIEDKYKLFRVLVDDLNQKEIQLSFKDETLENTVIGSMWDGGVDTVWKNDYLFAVDANLNAWKSDYYVKRSYAYTVDLSKDQPMATFAVTYKHTATAKDFMTKDYQTFLRLYVPDGSWLTTVSGNAKPPVFGSAFGKKYFGALVQVPLGTEKTVTFEYTLPKDLERDFYDLKIQKQAGLSDIPVSITVIKKDGTKTKRDISLGRDFILTK